MAVKIIHGHTCDDCEADGLHDVPAPHPHVISIDGGPFKQLDFCAPSDRTVLSRLIRLYEEQGAELAPEPTPEPEEELPKKAVTTQPKVKERKKPKELETAPEAVTPAKAKQLIVCTEPHSSRGGEPIEIEYSNRGTHTKMCHPGMQQWDITWGDPYGILKSPCTSHAECIKTGLAFTGGTGTATHVRNCSLPRIDTNDGPSSHEEAHD